MRVFTKDMSKLVLTAILAGYVYFIIKVILFKFGSVDVMYLWHQLQLALEGPNRLQNGLMSANLAPFETITMYWGNMSSTHHFTNLFGNIIIFVPYGVLITCVNRHINLVRVILLSFGFSLSLEVTQLVCLMGSFDVDDLLLNTAGGVIGYYIATIMLLPHNE